MFKNMANSLFEHGKIETTLHKAKDLRRVAEKLITLAGDDTLHRRRQAYSFLPVKKTVHKLFTEIGPQFKERPGGYTRVIRSRRRAGDAAEMAIIELVTEDYKPKKKKASKTRSTAKKAAAKPEPKKEEKAAETKSEEVSETTEASTEEK